MPEHDSDRRLSVSESYLGDVLGQMELRLVREITEVKEAIPSDDRIRTIAREEYGLTKRDAWNVRNVLITAGMFLLAISTFLLTALRGTGKH